MNKYFHYIKLFFIRAIFVKSDIITLIIVDLITIWSIIFLWLSILGENQSIAGYSLNDTIIYYLLAFYIRSLTFTNSTDNLAFTIKMGQLSEQLLKPRDIVFTQLARVIGDQVFKFLILTPFFLLILFTIFYNFNIPISLNQNLFIGILFGFIITIIAFLLGVFMDVIIGAVAFWIDEVWSLKHAQLLIFDLLTGKKIPLAFFPAILITISEYLPLRFLLSTPVEYILQKRDISNFSTDLIMLLSWLTIMFIFSKLIFKFGLKKYGAFGS